MRAFAEIGEDKHLVAIDPPQTTLGLRTLEAVGHERAGGQIEFASYRGVRAAAGEGDQRSIVVGPQQATTAPHPVLILLFSQFVQIQQRFPLGIGLAVLIQRGAPPDAALMILVAPEVVVVFAVLAHEGNAFVGVQYGQQVFAELVELVVLIALLGDLIALPDPVERLLAGDIFQPKIGVLFRCYRRDLGRQSISGGLCVQSKGGSG